MMRELIMCERFSSLEMNALLHIHAPFVTEGRPMDSSSSAACCLE